MVLAWMAAYVECLWVELMVEANFSNSPGLCLSYLTLCQLAWVIFLMVTPDLLKMYARSSSPLIQLLATHTTFAAICSVRPFVYLGLFLDLMRFICLANAAQSSNHLLCDRWYSNSPEPWSATTKILYLVPYQHWNYQTPTFGSEDYHLLFQNPNLIYQGLKSHTHFTPVSVRLFYGLDVCQFLHLYRPPNFWPLASMRHLNLVRPFWI